MIFQHFCRLFLPVTLKNVPCSLNELLVNFREESSGVRRFCRLEFQRMANWPSFDPKSILGELKYETGGLFRTTHPVFIKKSILGQLVIRWNFEPAKSANLTIFSPKLTNRQQGTFSTSPGEKACRSVEKSCFVFWNDNCWPPWAAYYWIGKQKTK